MQLTRQAQYAVRTVLDLAVHPQGRLADIAARQGIPPSFIGRIAQGLNRAGLLRTRRGVGGGVQLARPASGITLGDVIAAAEGPLAVNLCVLWGDCACPQPCPVRAALARLEGAMAREMVVTIDVLASQLPVRERRGAPARRRPRDGRMIRRGEKS
jgi:Rrf2 family protein